MEVTVRRLLIEEAVDASFFWIGERDARRGRRGGELSTLRSPEKLPVKDRDARQLRLLRENGGTVAGKFLHVHRLSQDVSGKTVLELRRRRADFGSPRN